MFKDLPDFVQKQVLNYLSMDNYSGAKALHDAWIRHSTHKVSQRTVENRIAAKAVLPEQHLIMIERILSIAE